MVNAKFEAQQKTIKHHWLNDIHTVEKIHKLIRISLRTVQYNVKKLKETGSVEHKRGNGQQSKVTQTISQAIGQNVRQNNTISTHQLANNIENNYDISILHVTVWNHMKKKGISHPYL
ncbi:hypothetical protein RclHR1_20770001 [Rhizophagus clarus]|uniref:Transposase Tc1-like domain-containing protein n=1 Tax=Rhizophagus clarus TaxID=94130 RepID=A0A2Z6QTU3_9GLOM|nr:hypothetical protein RclHR1_20770001 [Rhizophagus clarus]